MDLIPSTWPSSEPSFTSSFSSDESFYSSSTSFDRRFSAASCSDSWETGLSGSSSVLTPPSLPSTPTHDDTSRNAHPFWRQNSHMVSFTPDTKNSHASFLETSPMIHDDSPLSRYHLGAFPGDLNMSIATPSPLGSYTYDSTPITSQIISRSLRLPMHTPSLDDQIMHGSQTFRTRTSREGAMMPSYIYTPTVKSDPWSDDAWVHSKQTNDQRLAQLTHAGCNTVSPASIIVSPDAQTPFLSGSSEDAFISRTSKHAEADDAFNSSPDSDLDTLWNPTPVKQRRKYTKTRRTPAGPKKKQVTEYHRSLRGETFSIETIHVPPKTHKCDRAGCTRRFSRKEHLKRHMKVHAPGLLHSCALPDSICKKKFGRTDNRMQHYATHLKTKRGQAERNKIVDFSDLCRWIRKQEEVEAAEKTIAKLAKKMKQQEAEERTEFLHMNSRHTKGKKE